MAPFYRHFLHSRDFDLDAPSAAFESVWSSPSNYAFTILLLLGGDVVSRALAQLAGGRITPVAFSFGMSNFLERCSFHQADRNERLGILCNDCHQLRHWGEQADATRGYTLHSHQCFKWTVA